tara:strand:+ start:204 stop:830 length:627 start_codon:yes stop_codon:yes gene_type:complete
MVRNKSLEKEINGNFLKTKNAKKYGINSENNLEKEIINSEVFQKSLSFNSRGPGHPEKILGAHVGQILYFIDNQNWKNYRGDLRLMALLHDLGKPQVIRNDKGSVVGKGHSIISSEIAKNFIDDEKFIELIQIHDKYFHHFKNFQRDKFDNDKFTKTYFGKNLDTLIRFNYADGNNRERKSVQWFEDTCVNLGLCKNKLYVNEPNVLN